MIISDFPLTTLHCTIIILDVQCQKFNMHNMHSPVHIHRTHPPVLVSMEVLLYVFIWDNTDWASFFLSVSPC